MVISEEQRRRIEANRLAAIAIRNARTESAGNLQQQWRVVKCAKFDHADKTHVAKRPNESSVFQKQRTLCPEKFRARLEICSPDSFSVTPVSVRGFAYPGEQECFLRLGDILSDVIPSHFTQNHGGGKACVYKLSDYAAVLKCLKRHKGIEVDEIPWTTFTVVEKLSHSFESGRWEPWKPEYYSDEKVDELIAKLPRKLLDTLLPFQLEGLRFGLRRGGRCLIADEMGLGKTLQAIAIAGCFIDEGSILVVCPAILRFSWAEELERWLPFCLPSDIHLVFGHQNNPDYLTKWPKVVVISYTMLQHLHKTMLEREWAVMIVDESHHLRCSKTKAERQEVKAALDVAEKAKCLVLLSGTPSLSRPSLLGKDKYEFAKTYCDAKCVRGPRGNLFQDFSKGVRLVELNVLLKQTVMIRRLKQHVLMQLPPKRRQIVRLSLKKSDIVLAKAAASELDGNPSRQVDIKGHGSEVIEDPIINNAEAGEVAGNHVSDNASGKNSDKDSGSEDCDDRNASRDNHVVGKLSYQERGIAKLSGFCEWLSLHPIIAESDLPEDPEGDTSATKMVVFAHHHRVLDSVEEFVCEKGIEFVRIDGRTLPRDRQSAVLSFQSRKDVKIAIIGIEAGGVGLDFSAAQNVVFLELPHNPSLMLQAEDRAHRRGQTSAVNIYIFCAKDTMDESHWKYLNKSLHRVSSTTDGKYDAMHEIEIEDVYHFKDEERCQNQAIQDKQTPEVTIKVADEVNPTYKEEGKCDFETDLSVDFIDIKDDLNPDIELAKHRTPTGPAELPPDAEAGSLGPASYYEDENGSEIEHPTENMHMVDPRVGGGENVKHTDSNSYASLVASLRFEVSQYTGRIHLYSCTPGKDLRPRPLFENFRPEELELGDILAANKNQEKDSESVKDHPAYKQVILAFIEEWNKLRPIHRRKLYGKPLQLPLSLELQYLGESSSHDSKGLIRGGSKRRVTPLSELNHHLPPDAVWKKVRLCGNKKEKEYTQAWTLSNQPLCKLCQNPCMGSSAKEPGYFEDLFCNLNCYEEYRLRTSSIYLRQELFRIEHGICAICQLDCHKLVMRLKRLPLNKRQYYIKTEAPELAARQNLLVNLVNDPIEGNAWHVDHIVPVYKGGGECKLENVRTLCVACHANVTSAQCLERRATKVRARKQLRSTLNHLKNAEKKEKSDTHTEDEQCLKAEECIGGDELLVAVPGSAYSTEGNHHFD